MGLGGSGRRKTPLRVAAMLVALVVAAFIGAAAGLIWQSRDWLDQDMEEDVVTANQAPEEAS